MNQAYWDEIDRREKEDAERDPIALKAAQDIKRALPDAYVYKIRDNCYMASYGWSFSFIDADGVLVREWGGYHKPDQIEAIKAAIIKADAYWIEQYEGKTLDYEWHRSTKSEYVNTVEIL